LHEVNLSLLHVHLQTGVYSLQAQNGSTALHNAAANGHAKAVEALVAAPSCDCDVQNSNGNTALHLAASKGKKQPVHTAT